ncbi:hypothetical protein BB934_45860 (plasmid) [Microvirga ossetica]|uniref:Uncharacterized protein n=1 Tax=Microvirga ossetica TaxID=1882682 RepID=A0A1B2F029_9HYPH|nr:hypothetical protein [Microvirga ossetica]ANY85546.1 hypothetical protein BB934_45860 [Microvirga ossetica]
MAMRLVAVGLSAVLLGGQVVSALAQSRIPGAPSNAPPIGVDVTGRAEGIADTIENIFDNVNLWTSHFREEKIKGRLGDYLGRIGAKPTSGEIHLFYVQALVGNGSVELRDFQYLTHGKTYEDALRESFALENAPGTEDRLEGTRPGTRLEGIYVSATPQDGNFAIRAGSLSKDYYQKIRQEGFALRDRRAKELAEAQRIQAIRQQRAATHAASDPAAAKQLRDARAKGPPRSGVEIEASRPSPHAARTVYLPPTRSGPSNPQPTIAPALTSPPAHPRVPFNQPPPAAQPPVPIRPPG